MYCLLILPYLLAFYHFRASVYHYELMKLGSLHRLTYHGFFFFMIAIISFSYFYAKKTALYAPFCFMAAKLHNNFENKARYTIYF